MIVLLSLVWGACRHKAAAVVIVGKDDMVTVRGEVSFVNEGGTFRPDIWKVGNVVVFRVDGTVGGESGKAGRAYRINKDKKLEELEAVDPTDSDEQLAARYGVKAK